MTDDTKPGSGSSQHSVGSLARAGRRKRPGVIGSADDGAGAHDPLQASGGDSCRLTELLVAAGAGDRDAYCCLFRSVYGQVRAIAASVLQDDAQAEDVAQEALLEVWLKADRFDRNRGSAQAWIAVIARHRALDRFRQAHAARLRDTRYQHESVVRAGDDVAEIVMRRLMFVTAQSKFAVLTPLQREALILAFCHGHSYAAVAQLLAIPPPTVKTRIRDGLVRLRAALDEAA